MCATSITDDLEILRSARIAADEMLARFGVPIGKTLDIGTPRGFDAAVAKLASALRRLARVPEAEAVRKAVTTLDIDWRSASAPQRSAVVQRALEAAGRKVARIPQEIQVPLGQAATDVVSATRSDARRRHGIAIAADFNAIDRRAIDYVTRANVLFVRDEYGRRLEGFGMEARGVVARGLKQGLGRDDIGEALEQAAEAALVQRSASYWDLIAASLVGESRGLSQISAYAEAGIERYVLSAVLDEHTTNGCRFLDGKVLQTDDALRTFERLRASDDPGAIKRERPWVRERIGPDGKRSLVVERNGESTLLAVVERSGVGVRDDRGEYSRGLSGRDLAPAGLGWPPFHGFCRTVLAPA